MIGKKEKKRKGGGGNCESETEIELKGGFLVQEHYTSWENTQGNWKISRKKQQ